MNEWNERVATACGTYMKNGRGDGRCKLRYILKTNSRHKEFAVVALLEEQVSASLRVQVRYEFECEASLYSYVYMNSTRRPAGQNAAHNFRPSSLNRLVYAAQKRFKILLFPTRFHSWNPVYHTLKYQTSILQILSLYLPNESSEVFLGTQSLRGAVIGPACPQIPWWSPGQGPPQSHCEDPVCHRECWRSRRRLKRERSVFCSPFSTMLCSTFTFRLEH